MKETPSTVAELLERYRAGERDFSLVRLPDADLHGARLRDAVFRGASFARANLAGADLSGVDLSTADLGGADLHDSILAKASLAGADLRDADLTGASGLFPNQLGRADLTRAKLPGAVTEFAGLKRLETAIDGAQKLFLLMLAGCAYAGLTIWSTTDDRLLANLVTSPLPIIGTPIAIAEFYLVAPIVLTGVYVYLGLMLRHVWTGVAELPAVFPDGMALDRRLPVWFLGGWLHTRLPGARPLLTRAESWLSAFLAWWLVPLVLVLFWGRYLPARYWPYTTVHVALLVISSAGGVALYRLAARTLSVHRASFDFLRRARGPAIGALVTAIVFGLLSLQAMNARPDSRFAALAALLRPESGLFAELRERQLSARPLNWKAADGLDPVSGIQLPRRDLRHALARGAFLVKADLQQAIAPEVDLRGADLRGARLRGADLREANLMRVDLRDADLGPFPSVPERPTILRRAYLREANVRGARFSRADLEGADLRDVRGEPERFPWVGERPPWDPAREVVVDFSSANLRGADLRGSVLPRALLRDADLREAKISEAVLLGADLQGTNLQGAQLGRTDLREADLRRANLRGADLGGADLLGADLREAKISDAVLDGADLRRADLRRADLRGADLRGALCLTKEQLDTALTDGTTKLPNLPAPCRADR